MTQEAGTKIHRSRPHHDLHLDAKSANKVLQTLLLSLSQAAEFPTDVSITDLKSPIR